MINNYHVYFMYKQFYQTDFESGDVCKIIIKYAAYTYDRIA